MQQARRNYLITKQLIVRLLLLLLACGSFAPPVQARLVGKIRKVKPVVEIRRGTSGAWNRAARRTNIEPGHYIRSGPQGRAELSFTDGTRVTLNSRTQVFIEGDNTPAKPLGLRLFGAFSQIVVRNRGSMPIRAAAAIAAPRGTEYMVTLSDEDTVVLTVKEGSVRFYNAQGEQIVNANRQSTARTGQAPTQPVAVDASGLMQWAFDVSALPVEFEMGDAVQGDIDVLRRRAEANPNDAAAQRALAGALLADGDAMSAVSDYQRAVQLDPVDTSRVGLAIAQLARDDLAAARNALSPNPESALELAARGLVQLRSNDADAALQSLTQATQRDPRLPQAHSLLSLTHLTKNQIAPAIEAGRRAVQVAPNSSQAQAALSLALFYAGQSREATRAASRAVQLNPESPLALLVHGQALLAGHQTDAARAALQQAEGLAPDLPIIQSNLASAYLRLDMPQRAERAYRRVIAKTPNSAVTRAGLGGVLISTGQRAEGLAELQRALELDPESVPARAGMALYHIEMGDFAAAQRIATTIGDDPASGLLYIRLSEASLFQQKLFEAQEYARRAVKLLPDSAPAHYQLGRVYREQDRNVQAEQEFRQAVILDRNFAEARFAFGLARERAESGREFLNPLGTIASNNSGPRQALNVQNLQTPGAENRIQAAIQDPSIIRSASRAFGDNQIEIRSGEDDTNNLGFSHLQEIHNRRGSFGASLRRDHTDGVRANADLTEERTGLVWGSKKQDAPSGFFALAQLLRINRGGDTGLTSGFGAATRRIRTTFPLGIIGYNHQPNDTRRTLTLLQADDPSRRITDVLGFQNIQGGSFHGEVRHDRKVGDWNLSLGASAGRRHFTTNSLFLALPPPPGQPPPPDIVADTNTRVRQATAYLRADVPASRRLLLSGELKLQSLRQEVFIRFAPPVVPSASLITNSVVGLPKLIADYRLSRHASLRLRARKLAGAAQDFDLLNPDDAFLFSPSNDPLLNYGQRGHAIDGELTYVFANTSLLALSLGQHRLDEGTINSENLSRLKLQTLQLRYEGVVSKSATFFAGLNLSNASSINDFTPKGGPLLTGYDFSLYPRVAGQVGLQYLSRRGFFIQPSTAFIGRRFLPDAGLGTPRGQTGGFSLVNVRFGKRAGLRSSLFVEIANLLDKTWVTTGFNGNGDLQPGRQVRIGFNQRF
jgi:tetratricopeptide (TPR) repeat protein